MKKPHVINIMADQLRFDVLGKGFTPNIDSIALDGINFSNAYCASPLCVPSRGAFFTGTYPNCNGSIINPWEPADAKHGDVKLGIDNLYTLMENEWDSIHSGKQHLYTETEMLENRESSKTKWLSTEKSYKEYLKENEKLMPGGGKFRTKIPEMVDGKITRISSYSNAETGCYAEDEKYYFDNYFTEMAIKGLKNRDNNKPLLLNAMFLAPHPPLHIPQPWYDKIEKNSFEIPENVGSFYKRQSPLQMYNLTGIVGTRYCKEHWGEAWRVYLGLVCMLDNCVGRLLNELKNQGIYENCLIIFSSDHGEMLGSHGLFQKMCMYEESSKVPLYIKFPNSFKVKTNYCRQAVSHVDILPTLCDYLSLKPQHKMNGESLMPFINGEAPEFKKPVYIQYDGNGSRSNFQRCIIDNSYKLIADIFKDEVFYELYNLNTDPQEKENLLFSENTDLIAEKMAEKLFKHMKDTKDLIKIDELFSPKEFRKKYQDFPVL